MSLLKSEPLLILMILAFALLSCLMIPLYFYVRKPKLGTTEWISRLDPAHFLPLKRYPLYGQDVVWGLLTGLSSLFLHFICLVFLFKIPQRENATQVLRAWFPDFLLASAAPAVFGIFIFLLLRTMFDRRFCAISLGILGGTMLMDEGIACAVLAASVFFLYLWASAPYDAPRFPNAIWLLLSCACYAAALLGCPAMLWLLPFYAIVYIAVQAARFRNGEPGVRGKRFLISLLLIAGILVLAFFGVLAAYALKKGWLAYSGISLLFSGDFYGYMFLLLKEAIKNLFSNPHPLRHFLVGDIYALILGALAVIPLLHGIFRLRDSRCLLLLCLAVFSALGFLFSGYYFMLLPMLLIVDWTWSTYRKRGHGIYPVMFAVLTGLFYFLQLILH